MSGEYTAELLRLIERLLTKQHSSATDQPSDPNHLRLTEDVISRWAPLIDAQSWPVGEHPAIVLDVGAGNAIAKEFWENQGFEWVGISLGLERNEEVQVSDMHLLDYYRDASVIYARHVLEHSPFPLLALWRWRILAGWCILVVPSMHNRAFNNVQHISIFPQLTWERYIRFAGWDIVEFEHVEYNNPPPWPQDGSEWRWLLK